MFKDSLLMGIFPLPPLSPTANVAPINMISSSTSGSLGSIDPWVVPRPEDVESYGASTPLIAVEIIDPKIPSASTDTGQQLHPQMECDQTTPPTRDVDSPSSHDILDLELPSKEAIWEVMASIYKPKEGENHRESTLPSLELMRVDMMSLDLRPGALVGTSNRPPSLDPLQPWIYFSELAIEFSTTPSLEDLRFVLPSCLDGSHQGAFVAHETTHDEYLRLQKIVTMWHGPDMVSHMMLTTAHEFIDYEKDPWPEPSNGLYLV
jgi:hypothetical protein